MAIPPVPKYVLTVVATALALVILGAPGLAAGPAKAGPGREARQKGSQIGLIGGPHNYLLWKKIPLYTIYH